MGLIIFALVLCCSSSILSSSTLLLFSSSLLLLLLSSSSSPLDEGKVDNGPHSSQPPIPSLIRLSVEISFGIYPIILLLKSIPFVPSSLLLLLLFTLNIYTCSLL